VVEAFGGFLVFVSSSFYVSSSFRCILFLRSYPCFLRSIPTFYVPILAFYVPIPTFYVPILTFPFPFSFHVSIFFSFYPISERRRED
jgi:hypothetical protein